MLLAALLLFQSASAQAPALPPAPYPNPSAEAVALGTRLAETGTLASLLPMMAAKETDELVARYPDLSPEKVAELRRVAAATFATGKANLFAAEGRAYAERLSVADLRVLAARNGDAVSRRYRAAAPAVIASAMGVMGSMDFKGDTLAAFCAGQRAATVKACAAK
jgi:hypothetical protein